MKKEKNINLNKLNASKSSNNFKKKNPIIYPKNNNNNDFIIESSENKNNNFNFSYMTVNNPLLSSENQKQNHSLQKFNSFNNKVSSSKVGNRNNNKKATIGQYYVDIDLSLNNYISNDNKNKNNELINNNNGKQVIKKTINNDKSINSEIIDPNIFNPSIIEKAKKHNTKNIISLRNTNYLNRKKNFTSRERVPSILNQQPKKIDIKNKRTIKNRLIPYNTKKKTKK